MSVESLAIVLHHSRARGTDKLVLIGLANHDGDGGSWPSIRSLAKYANVSTRNVQKAIERLVDAGEVRVELNAGGNRETAAHLRPNRYRIRVSCPPDCDRSPQHRSTSDEDDDGLQATTSDPLSLSTPPVESDTGSPPVASDTGPLSPATPEPSLNQSTPKPPRCGGACRRHPDTPGDSCRSCGTTQRQLDAAGKADAAAQKRAEDLAATVDSRARRLIAADPASPTVRPALDAARTRIRTSIQGRSA